MRIAGMNASSYFSLNLNASSIMGTGSSSFGNSSSIYSVLSGNSYSNAASSAPGLNDILTSTYQFSNTLKTSTMSMQSSVSAISGFSAEAADQLKSKGSVSTEMAENLYKAASTFAGAYNSSVTSLYYAPSYSSFVQDVEKSLRGSVDNNLTALKNIGFSQDDDGKLSIDKDKFTKALQENPNAFKDLFGKTSNFTQALDKANIQAMDSRSINKAEISLAVRENYLSYSGYNSQGSYGTSSTSLLSSLLFNSFA